MNRRGFLTSCLVLSAAPAIVRAESLMKLFVPPQQLVDAIPPLPFCGDSNHPTVETSRRLLAQYVTHGVIGFGTNDMDYGMDADEVLSKLPPHLVRDGRIVISPYTTPGLLLRTPDNKFEFVKYAAEWNRQVKPS